MGGDWGFRGRRVVGRIPRRAREPKASVEGVNWQYAPAVGQGGRGKRGLARGTIPMTKRRKGKWKKQNAYPDKGTGT